MVRWPGSNHAFLRSRLLQTIGADLVLDVGANTGQFGAFLREHRYAGEIVSFEPMQAAYAALSARTADDPGWTAVRSAVGAETDELEINVAGNSISSSLLPMLDRHLAIAPHSAYVQTERVPVERLDVLVPPTRLDGRTAYLKVDVQGFESQVLGGVGELWDLLAGVELECSLVPLYEGQDLLPAMIERLADHGFRLAVVSPGLNDKVRGETLQVDAIFTRA
jgi:FkbM family methyltransferase